MIDKTRYGTVGLVAVLLLGMAIPGMAAAPAGVEEEAFTALQRMTDHLAGLQRFEVSAQATLEAVLTSGQKIQFDHDVIMLVERPNRSAPCVVASSTIRSSFLTGRS